MQSWIFCIYFAFHFFLQPCQTDASTTAEVPPVTASVHAVEVDSPSDKACAANFDAREVLEIVLAEDVEDLDPEVLPGCIRSLKDRGAHRCWHKHSTFLQHLLGVHNVLRLWGQGRTIGRVGLFHSAYSNSYVNLALYDPKTERQTMRELIGDEAEELVHLFCIINRQEVVVNVLLKQGFIPKEGLSVPHLRDPSVDVYLSPETLRLLVVFTMADMADQYFGWQDDLFGGGGYKGSMVIPGQDDVARHQPRSLWPGISRPGLWMSYLSQLGHVAGTFRAEWRNATDSPLLDTNGPVLDIPPVFANCTQVLSVEDEAEAIDMYWTVSTGQARDVDEAVELLRACSAKNPWAYEPYVLLTQYLLHEKDFEGAEIAAKKALQLEEEWGVPWDKRLSFGAWVAWTRVLLQRAQDKEAWPTNSWDVNNLGLVR